MALITFTMTMKLTIQMNDNTYSVESKFTPDATELTTMFRGLMVAAGFHPATAESMFSSVAIDDWGLCVDDLDTPPSEEMIEALNNKLSEQDYECHSQTS